MSDWTTRMPPERSRSYGVEEIHTVFFAPRGWPGKGTSLSLGIPECELHTALIQKDWALVILTNQPQHNPKVEYWTRAACDMAVDYGASIAFNCNTAAQAIRAAKQAKRWLPGYERVPLERLYDANARADLN